MDETYVKVAGRWVYLYRALDQFGQVIDVYASTRRDTETARRFFQRARKATGVVPVEVITDRAPTYPRVLDEMWPAAWHHVERYANNRVEADHAQLKRWLRPMGGIKTMTGLRVLAAGLAPRPAQARPGADRDEPPAGPDGVGGHPASRPLPRPATPRCAGAGSCRPVHTWDDLVPVAPTRSHHRPPKRTERPRNSKNA